MSQTHSDIADHEARPPLSSLDQGIVLCEQGREMTIHFDITLVDPIDGDRFRSAVRSVMERSARLRSRVVIKRWTSNTLRWSERSAAESVDVAEVECTRAELAEIRDAFVGRGFDVTLDPLVRFLIAHHGPEGSSLVVLSHHVLSDATGIWAIIVQIAEQYGREGDVPEVSSPVEGSLDDAGRSAATDGSVPALESDQSGVGAIRAILGAARAIVNAPRPERLVPRGGVRSDGAMVELRIIEEPQVAAILDSTLMTEVPGARLNDLLLLGLHRTLARWNALYGAPPLQISVTVPMNQRRRDDRSLRNSAGQSSTVTNTPERAEPRVGLLSIVGQTQVIKQERGRADPSSSAASLWFMPTGVRALIPRLVGFISRERFLNTSRLSNLGRVELPESGLQFGDVYFSAPARMPQGATVGVVQSGPNLTLCLRCCRRLWDRSAAREFADLLVDELLQLSAS